MKLDKQFEDVAREAQVNAPDPLPEYRDVREAVAHYKRLFVKGITKDGVVMVARVEPATGEVLAWMTVDVFVANHMWSRYWDPGVDANVADEFGVPERREGLRPVSRAWLINSQPVYQKLGISFKTTWRGRIPR